MRSRRYKKILRFILGVLALAVGGTGIFLFFILQGVPDPARLNSQNIVQSTKILDRTGEVVLYDVHGEEKRTVIPFEKIPDNLKRASIAIEDANFYSHGGVDFKGILRAFYVDLTSGGIKQGGSTITQQLITNSLLSRGNSVSEKILRKIREIALAVVIETKYTKDEILSLYLNQIPYGSNAYGAEAAAETFFGKSAVNLTLAESALLASLPRAPSYYSPYGSHLNELLARKNLALERMAELGFISESERDRAKKEKLNLKRSKQKILAPHFVLYVKEYLAEKYGEAFVERGGLKVMTTLDWDLQQKAEEIVRAGAERNASLIDAQNAAMVAMDPKTGEVLAMVGSKDYFGEPSPAGCTPGINCQFDPQVNVAIMRRQPGSAFKPFVYATAIARGYTPETVLFDVPTEFNTNCNADGTAPAGIDPKNCYSPGNYDEKFRGPVTVRQALAQSLNVPSVELLYLAGVEDSIKTANRVGITTIQFDPARYGLALVLGGAEVTLLDMTHSYGAFARNGQQTPPASILRIEDAEGNILEENKPDIAEVINPEVARTINDILSDNEARQPVFAPRSSLYLPDRPVAAKTGTTQDYRDAWTIGYTPSLVVGVWSGNNDNRPMKQKGSGVLASAPMWHDMMEATLQNKPVEQFIKPVPVTVEKPILRGLWRGGTVVVIDKISKKLATPETPEELREEIVSGEPHTTLYWVDRNDPRGPAPENPDTDPQFNSWEAALHAWLSQNPAGPQPNLPTEYDTLHTEANRPKLFVSLPLPGDVISRGSPIEIRFSFRAVFPMKTVDFILNDQIQKTMIVASSPVVTLIPTENLEAGQLILKIRAVDSVENKAEVSLPILLTP